MDVIIEVSRDLMDQPPEWELQDEQLSTFLVTMDFLEAHYTWSVPVRFLNPTHHCSHLVSGLWFGLGTVLPHFTLHMSCILHRDWVFSVKVLDGQISRQGPLGFLSLPIQLVQGLCILSLAFPCGTLYLAGRTHP